jgi:membrane protease YdiL (CAAX protease family)
MDDMRFHQRHPYVFVGVLEAAVVGVFIFAGALTRRIGLPLNALYWIGFVILTVMSVVLLTRMRWWTEVGFRRLGEYRLLWLPVLPVIVTMFQTFSGEGGLIRGTVVLFMLVLTALNGFVEEVVYRGMMLRALVPKGIWRALVITSVIFAFTHSMNVLTGWSPERVLWQLCYSFAVGFGWAAFALRTGTIWPLILIHFLNNFFSLWRSSSVVQTGEVSALSQGIMLFYTVAFIAYGVVVTRSHIKAQGARAISAAEAS